ncbi:MAG: DUF29 domain-containing protein [Acaryochloridaceae cyanobacterium RU_4_10]|nr:DUF29 domain-containing protein [Acaryochloridaceae cyanobacterium RU_4_10]
MTTQLKQTLYHTDFVAWAEQTVELLRSRQLDRLDFENLIEEVEDLGKSQRQALYSNLRVLVMHLLKWQFQPEKRTNSWRYTLREHRQRIEEILEDSPSLRNYALEIFEPCYVKARLLAADETDLPISTFPETCPYTVAEILNSDFLP